MQFPTQTNMLAKQVVVKSAVNPSLWACVTVSIPFAVLATTTKGWLSFACFFVAVIPVGVFAYSYLYLIFKNPEYVRSEEYQLSMNKMRYMGDKDNPEVEDTEEIIPLENPKLPKPKLKQKQIS